MSRLFSFGFPEGFARKCPKKPTLVKRGRRTMWGATAVYLVEQQLLPQARTCEVMRPTSQFCRRSVLPSAKRSPEQLLKTIEDFNLR